MIRRRQLWPLLLAIALACPPRDTRAGSVRERAIELMKSDEARVFYSWPFRYGVEGVAFVRIFYGASEYLLLGAPDLGLTAAGGPTAIGKKVTQDAAIGVLKLMVDHPEKTARHIASWAFARGKRNYLANYALYRKHEGNPEGITDAEANRFVRGWHYQNLMTVAKRLYNDTTAYKKAKGRYAGGDRANVMAVESAIGKIPRKGAGKAARWMEVFRLVQESEVGLAGYPPYQAYLQASKELHRAFIADVGELAPAVGAGAEITPASGEFAGAFEIKPPMKNRGMQVTGWSADGAEFGACYSSGMVMCDFIDTNQNMTSLAEDDHTAMERRLKKNRYSLPEKMPSWEYGRDIVIRWHATKGGRKLRVGAEVRGENAPEYLSTQKCAPGSMCGYTLLAVVPNPSGSHLAVLTFRTGEMEFDEDAYTAVYAAGDFAARGYNAAGLKHYKKKALGKALEYWRKAVAAAPDYWAANYNLACALALLDEPGAEAALAKAIETGGKKIKKKARKDKDFKSVRKEAWFVQLTRK